MAEQPVILHSLKQFILPMKIEQKYLPAFRYAFGATFIMAIAMASGEQLAYIVPILALSFLAPGSKGLSFKQGVGFVLTVLVTSFLGFYFTRYFYDFTWVFIPLLGLGLFWIFYTDSLTMVAKLFLLISLLATPIPMDGISTTVWSFAIAKTLVSGAFYTILVVWIVYALFPDKAERPAAKKGGTAQKNTASTSSERFSRAVEIFIITFPVTLAFIFFQWSNGLLVLLYIVILTMIPVPGKIAGKVKILGNILGGIFLIIFYELVVIVPDFFFFLVLYLGTALFFAYKVFSDSPYSSLYKTGFSTLTLIIGESSTGTGTAASEIWIRIIQVIIAVFYTVGVANLLAAYKERRKLGAQKRKNKTLAWQV